jgi:hypothetical protein
MKFRWEQIGAFDYRAWVIGGWVFASVDHNDSSAICFIPDPNHEWSIDEEQEVPELIPGTKDDLDDLVNIRGES